MTDTVHVLDAIPGTGKSTGAINYINSNTKKHFIFVCSYLTEVDRIEQATRLISPKEGYTTVSGRINKSDSFLQLVTDKSSIVCTQQLFKSLTVEIIDKIKSVGYEIIIDEVIDPIIMVSGKSDKGEFLVSRNDIKDLRAQGMLSVYGGLFIMPKWTALPDTKYKEFNDLCHTGQLVINKFDDVFQLLPIKLFRCAKKITVLTYLFAGSHMHRYFQLFKFKVKRETEIKLTKDPRVVGEKIKSLINIKRTPSLSKLHDYQLDDKKITYSANYYSKIMQLDKNKKIKKDREVLQKIIRSCARNSNATVNDLMYTYRKSYAAVGENKIKNKNKLLRIKDYAAEKDGNYHCFIPMNCRGTNDYKHKSACIYGQNRYPPKDVDSFLKGINPNYYIDPDNFALSQLIQWLFRSRIRDDQPIDVYLIPIRMQRLLEGWIENL